MKSEIQYIKRADLDEEKYMACIDKSPNTLIYAYPWYLDIVCDDWAVLMYGDYKAVMPIPYLKLKRHLWQKKIYNPDWVQQLGVFAQTALTSQVYQAFYNDLINLKPKTYHFNFYDTKHFFTSVKGLKLRVNHELILDLPYKELKDNYSKNRKRNLRKTELSDLQINTELDVRSFVDFVKYHGNYQLKKRALRKMELVVESVLHKNHAKIFSVFNKNDLVSVLLVLETQNRLTTLLAASNELGKKSDAQSYLIDHLIQVYAITDLILDFEGSMIPGVARFYKSFGGVEVNYASIE